MADPIPVQPLGPILMPEVPLTDLMDEERCDTLDRQERYYRCTQDDAKEYDWHGYFRGYGPKAAARPGWYVPVHLRAPSTTVPVARTIVSRLTNMLFGSGNEPQIACEADEETQRWVRACADDANLWARMVEARRKGGSVGSVVLSWGFAGGKPRIEVHNAKHCQVLLWEDRSTLSPAVVVKVYPYTRRVIDEGTRRYLTKRFFFVRYWDPWQDVVWEAVPEEIAALPLWMQRIGPSSRVAIPGEVCPVAWIQNTLDSEDVDGECDYHGQLENLDEINRMASGASKGVIANIDPTLVIKDDRRANPGVVKKGHGHAIYSPGGAEYLEVKGDAARTAIEVAREVKGGVMAASQVVDVDPEKVSGAAQSAAALRLLFAPQTARVDELRGTYGDGACKLLKGLLRQARALPEGAVVLRPVAEAEAAQEPGDVEKKLVTPVLGKGEDVTLVWPTYFSPTWPDKQAAVTAVQTASGGKPLISQKTALRSVADLFGVEDVDAELAAVEEDAEAAMDREVESMERMTQVSGKGAPGNEDAE